jgi:hypothetical protein
MKPSSHPLNKARVNIEKIIDRLERITVIQISITSFRSLRLLTLCRAAMISPSLGTRFLSGKRALWTFSSRRRYSLGMPDWRAARSIAGCTADQNRAEASIYALVLLKFSIVCPSYPLPINTPAFPEPLPPPDRPEPLCCMASRVIMARDERFVIPNAL